MPRTRQTLPRLYLDQPLAVGDDIALDKAQSNYLLNVLRRKAGEEAIVFNGREGAYLARIVSAGKKLASLDLIEQTAAQTPPSDLWYGFAPLKTARLDYMAQKATEMGAGILQPVMTERTQPGSVNLKRLYANAIEAAEQCEVLSIPRVEEPIALNRLIATWTESQGNRTLILADEGEDSASPVETLTALKGSRVGLLIGPEGGFSGEERALLRAQPFTLPVSLGPRILRADTAAVAALAVIQSIIGDWR